MPKKIRWPDQRVETVEDHLAELWVRQGRAQLVEEPQPEPAATKDIDAPVQHKAVTKAPAKKALD